MNRILKCPQCGANMTSYADGSARCDYCGAQLTTNTAVNMQAANVAATDRSFDAPTEIVAPQPRIRKRIWALVIQIVFSVATFVIMGLAVLLIGLDMDANDLAQAAAMFVIILAALAYFLISLIPCTVSLIFGGIAIGSKDKKISRTAIIFEVLNVAYVAVFVIFLMLATANGQ